MKKKILLIILLTIGLVSLTACTSQDEKVSDAKKFKEEYESFNGQKNDYFEYRSLSIDEDNPIVYTTASDIVKRIENKETFIVYFGDPECPWCRSVIEKAIESANEIGISKIYYVRMWDGFHNEILRDTYELEDGTPKEKSKGTDDYYKLLNYFDSLLEDYTLTDDNGKTVKVGEKRLFAPSFISIEKGIAKELVQGISENQESFNSKLTEEIKNDEKEIFDKFYKKTILCSDKC